MILAIWIIGTTKPQTTTFEQIDGWLPIMVYRNVGQADEHFAFYETLEQAYWFEDDSVFLFPPDEDMRND